MGLLRKLAVSHSLIMYFQTSVYLFSQQKLFLGVSKSYTVALYVSFTERP